jgi:siroheme synthase-like protein
MGWSYPVFLDLRGRRCLVIGSGFATRDKVLGLVQAGAEVTLLAPDAPPELEALAAAGTIRHLKRDYRTGDLEGFFLAVSTHEDKSRNEPIWQEALSRNILFNAVDDPARCGFAFPSVHRQGDLAIAISTNGKCPALAVRLRQRLEREIGPEYAAVVDLFGEMRDEIAAAVPEFERRKQLWYRLVDSNLPESAPDGEGEPRRSAMRANIKREIENARTDS